jgi:hypothetical protein
MDLFSNKYNSFHKVSSESSEEDEAFLQGKANGELPHDASEKQHRTWTHILTWPLAMHTGILFIWVTIAVFVIRGTTPFVQKSSILTYCK